MTVADSITVDLPAGWNRDATLADDVLAAVQDADCCWLQVVTELGFVLAALLLGQENEAMRVAVAEALAGKLLETARSGQMPGVVLQ